MSDGQSGQENAFICDVRTAPEKAVFWHLTVNFMICFVFAGVHTHGAP